MAEDAIPRVLVLTHTAQLGGGERLLPRVAVPLRQRGCDIRVLSFSDGPLVDQLRATGVNVEILPLDPRVVRTNRYEVGTMFARGGVLVSTIRFLVQLTRRLRRGDVDVVHANSLKSGVLGSIAGRFARKPVVWYVHDRISDDYLPSRTAAVLRWAMRILPTQILTNSQATLSTIRSTRSQRGAVVYPGIEAAAFRDHSAANGQGEPIVGIVGRISPTKGQDVFLRAAQQVLRQNSGVRFVIVGAALFGESEYADQLRTLAADLGISESVRFTGEIPDIYAELLKFSVFVHASPVPEPFGHVVLEAAAAGIPVIATEAGGVVEILRDPEMEVGDFGILVPPGDADALAEAMCDVVENPADAAKRAQWAADSIRRRFTIEVTAERLIEEWSHAAAGR